MNARILKTVYVETARRLPNPTVDGSPRYTGNSYQIDLIAEGPVHPEYGWVVDYTDLKALFEPIYRQLDHRCLDDIPALRDDHEPEDIEAWINESLQPWPSWFAGVRVSLAVAPEFQPRLLPPDPRHDLPERLAFSFSAAQSLPQLPEDHPCRKLHGHSYQVEIAAEEKDKLETIARRLFQEFNNQYLNTLAGLEQATSEHIAARVWKTMTEEGASPLFVAIQETPSNRCHYFGGRLQSDLSA
jgi:6-pyruvoyltetrahydropterin/6-carboxytetrahydropterin synthase